MTPVRGRVRWLRDLTTDDLGEGFGLACLLLTVLQLLRLALP